MEDSNDDSFGKLSKITNLADSVKAPLRAYINSLSDESGKETAAQLMLRDVEQALNYTAILAHVVKMEIKLNRGRYE